jgi:hypothetical protein
VTASEAVGEEREGEVRASIAEVLHRYNRVTDGTVIVEAEYVQAIAVRA